MKNLLEYRDETTMKVPFITRIGIKMAGGIPAESRTAEELIAYYRDMNEEQYQKLKEQVKRGVRIKQGVLRYHPVFVAQRKMQKELQNKGYNNIFIPNLKVLSPQYAEYHDALEQVNDRICQELGLYYDSNYKPVIKNSSNRRQKCGCRE